MTDLDRFPATQWFKNGDHPNDYVDDDPTNLTFNAAYRKQNNWEGDVVRYFRDPDIRGTWACGSCRASLHDHGWIDSGGDGRMVCPGDWVVTINGEHYPVKPYLYAALFGGVG